MRELFRMIGCIADDLFQVTLDSKTNGGHWRIRRFILERVLQVNGHFFDQEKNRGNNDNNGYAHEPEKVNHSKREQQKKEKQRKMDIQTIRCGKYRVFYPLAFSHRIA